MEPQTDNHLEEEDDEILFEMNVFINQQLADELYVLQYPLRSSWNPYPAEAHSAQFKVKTNTNEHEISRYLKNNLLGKISIS